MKEILHLLQIHPARIRLQAYHDATRWEANSAGKQTRWQEACSMQGLRWSQVLHGNTKASLNMIDSHHIQVNKGAKSIGQEKPWMDPAEAYAVAPHLSIYGIPVPSSQKLEVFCLRLEAQGTRAAPHSAGRPHGEMVKLNSSNVPARMPLVSSQHIRHITTSTRLLRQQIHDFTDPRVLPETNGSRIPDGNGMAPFCPFRRSFRQLYRFLSRPRPVFVGHDTLYINLMLAIEVSGDYCLHNMTTTSRYSKNIQIKSID